MPWPIAREFVRCGTFSEVCILQQIEQVEYPQASLEALLSKLVQNYLGRGDFQQLLRVQ